MSDQKPREFDLKFSGEYWWTRQHEELSDYQIGKEIKTIEKSAYDELVNRLNSIEKDSWDMITKLTKENQKLRADLDLAIEALKFYASGEHLEADDFDTETLDQGDFDLHENTHGKLARETLAKLQERK